MESKWGQKERIGKRESVGEIVKVERGWRVRGKRGDI